VELTSSCGCDDKGDIQLAKTIRIRVPMRKTGEGRVRTSFEVSVMGMEKRD